MLLADFIKELKHKSLWLDIIDMKPEENNAVFAGTMGELIHDVTYVNTYNKYGIVTIKANYSYDMKSMLAIYIYEVV